MDEFNKEIMDDVVEVVADNVVPAVSGKNGVIGLVIGGIGLAAAGGIALWKKNKIKDQIDEMKIRRLEKKGYVVTKPEPAEEPKKDSDK